MKNNEIVQKDIDIQEERKILLKNTLFSYLNDFGLYFFPLITSFFMARLISPQAWGLLILAFSYITIISIISSFLPPGLQPSLVYYIPRYFVVKENGKLKSIIKFGIILRVLFLIPIFVLSILIFNVFIDIFKINLHGKTNLLFILSPLIFVNGLHPLLKSINQGFNMFKTNLILLTTKYLFNIGALVWVFIFIQSIKVEDIAIITLISSVIPFVINFIIILNKYLKIKIENENGLKFKNFVKQTLNYGTYIEIGNVALTLWNQTTIQSLGIFESSDIVTAYHISTNFSTVPYISILSKNQTLRITFSRLDKTNNLNYIYRIFNLFLHYGVFLFLLLNGIFYFLTDFFLNIIYTNEYLVYSYILKLMLISIVFNVLGGQFETYLISTNKVKFSFIIKLIKLMITIPFFFIGLIFYSVIGMFIGICLSNLIMLIYIILICYKKYKINLYIKKLLNQYICFFLSLVCSLWLGLIFLDNFNERLYNSLNLRFLAKLPIFTIIVFILIYLILNFLFKIFTYEDIQFLEDLLNKDKKIHRFALNILKSIKKILAKR